MIGNYYSYLTHILEARSWDELSKDVGKAAKISQKCDLYKKYPNKIGIIDRMQKYCDHPYVLRFENGYEIGLREEDIEILNFESSKKKTSVKWFRGGKLVKDETWNEEEYEDFLIDDEFRQFLLKNDAYEKFINNFLNQRSDLNKYKKIITDPKYKSSIINISLNWDLTKEGHKYWGVLHELWKDYCYGKMTRESLKCEKTETINEEIRIQGKKAIGKRCMVKRDIHDYSFLNSVLLRKKDEYEDIYGIIVDYGKSGSYYKVKLDDERLGKLPCPEQADLDEIPVPSFGGQYRYYEYKEIIIFPEEPVKQKEKIRWFRNGKLGKYEEDDNSRYI